MRYPAIYIVIMHNHEDDPLRQCLDSLAATSYPEKKIRIMVIDSVTREGGSTLLPSDHTDVPIIRNEGGTHSWIHRLPKHIKTNNLLVLIGADLAADKDLLKGLVSSLEDDEIAEAVVGGVLLSDEGRADVHAKEEKTQREIAKVSQMPLLCRYGVLRDILSKEENHSLHVGEPDLASVLKENHVPIVESPGCAIYLGTERGTMEAEIIDEPAGAPIPDGSDDYDREAIDRGSTNHYSKLFKQGRNGFDSIVSDIVRQMKSTEDAVLLSGVLPGVFEGMQLVLALEKDYLSSKAEMLEKIIDDKETRLEEQREMIRKLNETLEEKVSEIDHLKKCLADDAVEHEQDYLRLCERDRLIREKDRLVSFMEEELRSSREQLEKKAREAETFSNRIEEIYSSDTYRLVAKPLWRIFRIVESVTGNRKALFLGMAIILLILISVVVLLTMSDVQ